MSASKPSPHVWDCDRMLRMRCPQKWAKLASTPEADVRHCGECDREVYLCRTPTEFVEHGEQGHCVAIPDLSCERSPGLGEPSLDELLRHKELVQRGVDWFEEALHRQTTLSAEQVAAIQAARDLVAEFDFFSSPRHLAILKLAARDGGIRCPHCGVENASDMFGILILEVTGQCENCKEPLELEFPSE